MRTAYSDAGGLKSVVDEAYTMSRGGAADEDRHPLDAFFRPRSVAVIGASDRPDSVGRSIFWNLVSNPFGGAVYPINPKHKNTLGIPTYARITEAPEPIELAIIITPAATVPDLMDDCAKAHVKGVIIISAGFTETGEAGHALEQAIRKKARLHNIRVIGPNCLGVMNPVSGLNAAFSNMIAVRGSLGFVSQSGAICSAILDWSRDVKMGFSKFVSFGAMVDVSWADLIYYLGNDPDTKSIVLYIQSIGDARSFISAAREVARSKPIIILKAGQTEVGARIARSTPYFSATDACRDEVLSAALRRSGVLRVYDVESLFAMAEVLGKQPPPKGPRLTILSNSAGPSILAADALIAAGGSLVDLSPETFEELNGFLPPYWNKSNPIDILADADPQRFAAAAAAALRDKNSDGLLVILAPQAMTRPTATAEALCALDDLGAKPLLASWMGGNHVARGKALLNSHNIPALNTPDTAARVFGAMWRHSYILRSLYETPVLSGGNDQYDRDLSQVKAVFEQAQASGRSLLTEAEAKTILAAYGVPVVETGIAHSEEEALCIATRMGYPVALKLNYDAEETATHLNLMSEADVREAFAALKAIAEATGANDAIAVRPMIRGRCLRTLLMSDVDPQFGPVIEFGSGGPLGEVIHDTALGLPPLNSTLARRLIEQTRIYAALRGESGLPPVDTDLLEQILVRFSYLVAEQRRIKAIRIHPLLVMGSTIIALEARMELHAANIPEQDLPTLAIRPYPIEYIRRGRLKNGAAVIFRPIRPEDESMMVRFHETLSKDTVYFRYFRLQTLDQRIKHDRLSEMCFIDYDRGMALVVEAEAPENGERCILGVGRIVKMHDTRDADFAIVISDQAQGQGLGTELLRQLVEVCRAERIHRLVGAILPDNRAMLRLCKSLGFRLVKPYGEEVIAEMIISP